MVRKRVSQLCYRVALLFFVTAHFVDEWLCCHIGAQRTFKLGEGRIMKIILNNDKLQRENSNKSATKLFN